MVYILLIIEVVLAGIFLSETIANYRARRNGEERGLRKNIMDIVFFLIMVGIFILTLKSTL